MKKRAVSAETSLRNLQKRVMGKKKLLTSLIFSIICLVAIFVVNFFLPRLMPGDPLAFLMGAEDAEFTQEDYDYYYHEMGLDQPLSKQFGNYIKDLFHGNLGYSYHYGKDVSKVIAQKIPRTLQVVLPAWIISAVLAYFLGTYAGYKKGTLIDSTVTGGMVVLDTMPSFLVGILLLIIFAYQLKLLPFGNLSSTIPPESSGLKIADRIEHLVLPVLSIVLISTPNKYMLMRNTTAKAMGENYIVYAQSRGLSGSKIRIKHIFCNIGQPFISMLGTSFGHILSGSIVIEKIFSIDGMGMLTNTAIMDMDYPMLQATLMIIAVCVIISHFVTDIICALITPRAKAVIAK